MYIVNITFQYKGLKKIHYLKKPKQTTTLINYERYNKKNNLVIFFKVG